MSDPKPNDDRPITFLEWIGLSDEPDLGRARWVGTGVGIFLALVFAGAVIVAIIVMIGTARDVMGGAGTGPNLGAGALIAAILGAPFLIWATIIKHRALGFQKEGHLTDRISAAVEQLGAEKVVEQRGRTLFYKVDDKKLTTFEYDDAPFTYPANATDIAQREWLQMKRSVPNIEVRIGGILSLERIAQDSTKYDKGRDHVRVMEILCAYVRENAPRTKANDGKEAAPPRLDIQKALDVIKRRGRLGREIEAQERYRLDLRETDLRGYDLSRGDFVGAVFWFCNLEGTNFWKSDLTGTQFQQSIISNVVLLEAIIVGTNFGLCETKRDSLRTGISMADSMSILIEGAKLPFFTCVGNTTQNIFGSRDTEVYFGAADKVKFGRRVAEARLYAAISPSEETQNELAKHETENVALGGDSETLAHWNPFTSNDGFGGYFRQAFKQKHNLIGWPFDD